MRRSESSSATKRNNGRRKSSFAGGRTASASMIGLLTLKSSTSIADATKKEKSGWSKLFSPLSFGFEKKERENSGYSLSRRRTRDYSRSCPNFQRKGSLRPSSSMQIREESRRASLSAGMSECSSKEHNSFERTDIRSLTKSVYSNDDIIGIDDLSSTVFEPVIASNIFTNNIGFSRVQAFSGKEAGMITSKNNQYGRIVSNRFENNGSFDYSNSAKGDGSNNTFANNVQILRFHDGITGKTYKSRTINDKDVKKSLDFERNYIEIDSNTKVQMFNKDEYSVNRNTCVKTSLENDNVVQGDIPYCDTILYLDNPKPVRNNTCFSELHDRCIYTYSDKRKDSFVRNNSSNQTDH
ncbi:hypothetical protein FG386_003388 [Cryptosporidium ryanae]|uniref:uncharacterized protein n=1 Tax=Cryptosporidium ryanae TaxID=515981 RepID=UPI00351A0A85|nr:hypothetical protein FG386_003388 [Cryptosporidium ryanae]